MERGYSAWVPIHQCVNSMFLLPWSGSNNCINIYERDTLQPINNIGSGILNYVTIVSYVLLLICLVFPIDCHGAEGTITGLQFADHALWSACTDGMIR